MPRRVYNFLRSRRLAVGLIGGLVGYAALVTMVPGVIARPFFNPPFVLAALLLLAATTACALERTLAWRMVLLRERDADAARAALARRLGRAVAPSCDDPLASAAQTLEALGMAVRTDGGLVRGTARRWAGWASPLFHWALAGLLASVILGQLARVEGGINLVVGQPVVDESASYLPGARQGLFSTGFTGQTLTAEETTRSVVVDGVHRGEGALLSVARGGTVVARQWVYPNNVLRTGPLMVFVDATGPAAVLDLASQGVTASAPVAFDQPVGDSGLLASERLGVSTADGGRLTLDVEPLTDRRVRVVASNGQAGELAEGQALEVDGFGTVVLRELTSYARIAVVNDRSIPFVYTFFVLALLGVTVALFLPPRFASVLLAEEDGIRTVHIAVRAVRADPAFAGRVGRAIHRTVGAPEPKE